MALRMWDTGWMEHGVCRHEAPELFFPLGMDSRDSTVRAAKEVCHRCPVRRECLDYAVDTNQPSGIWGGTTELERRGLKTARYQ